MKITKQQKIAATKHILYEMVEMILCNKQINALAQNFNPEDDSQCCAKSAYLEALLLHIRILRDFFQFKPKTPDKRDINNRMTRADMYSVDFGFKQQKILFDPELRFRLNKELAHLSYHRLHSSIFWYGTETIEKIIPACKAFLMHLKSKWPGIDNADSEYYKSGMLDGETLRYWNILKKHLQCG
ncbi:hypothetical protein ACFL5V_09365 [Fibrobacterota bacterium]